MSGSKEPETIAKVVQGQWDAQKLRAIVFLANPRGGTQRQLAEDLGVHESRISEWKLLDGFMADVHRVAAAYFLEADLQVDRAVLKEALGGDMKAAELYYRRRGLLVEKREHKFPEGVKVDHAFVGVVGSVEIPDELAAKIDAVAEDIIKHQQGESGEPREPNGATRKE